MSNPYDMNVSLNESQINLEGNHGYQEVRENRHYEQDPYAVFYQSQQHNSPQNFYPTIEDSGPKGRQYPDRSNISMPRNVYQFEEG